MDFRNILSWKEHMKTHPFPGHLCPAFQPSPACQPRLLKCNDCNLGFDTVKEFYVHNKSIHPKPKPRRSAPTHGHSHGGGSLPKSPKPPPVGRSVTIHSGNQNNTQLVPTPSENCNKVVSSNPLGKGVSEGQPLKNIPVQHISDSHPRPISNKQVKKEIENGSGSGKQQADLSVVQMSDVYFVCPVCKECFSEPKFVREHQELIHVEYKFACNDANCLHIFKTKCGQTSAIVKMEILLLNKKKIRQRLRNPRMYLMYQMLPTLQLPVATV